MPSLPKKVMNHYFFIQKNVIITFSYKKDVNHYFWYKLVMNNSFCGAKLYESSPFVSKIYKTLLLCTKKI